MVSKTPRLPGETRFLALPYGTAVAVPPALLAAIRAGATMPAELIPWSDFLSRLG